MLDENFLPKIKYHDELDQKWGIQKSQIDSKYKLKHLDHNNH